MFLLQLNCEEQYIICISSEDVIFSPVILPIEAKTENCQNADPLVHNIMTRYYSLPAPLLVLSRHKFTGPPEAICGWSGAAVSDEVITKSRAKRAAKFWT